MKDLVLNRLRLGKKYVGYRLDVFDGTRRVASFDVSDENVKSFLRMFHNDNIKKGVVIDGSVSNGVFSTPNEEMVFEVAGKDVAESLIRQYYFGSRGILPDVFEITETQGEIDDREHAKFLKEIESVEPSIADIGDFDYKNYGEIPYVYEAFSNAIVGTKVQVHVSVYEDGVLNFSCIFVDLTDILRFVYNLWTYLGKTSVTFSAMFGLADEEKLISKVDGVTVSFGSCQNDFISSVLSILKVPSNVMITSDKYYVYWGDSEVFVKGFEISSDDEVKYFRGEHNCSYPTYYNGKYGDVLNEGSGMNYEYDGFFAPSHPWKYISVDDCSKMFHAYGSTVIENYNMKYGNIDADVEELINLGFSPNEMYLLAQDKYKGSKKLQENRTCYEEDKRSYTRFVIRENKLLQGLRDLLKSKSDVTNIMFTMIKCVTDKVEYLSYLFDIEPEKMQETISWLIGES